TKASAAQPLASCGSSKPFCLASPPLACSSSTTRSASKSTDPSRRSLQSNPAESFHSW
ncbi:hypothetical protein XENOCAPTIV_000241, partial [Xenoophorus captivus]